MARKHLFPIVVLLAGAAVAGLLAVTRTAQSSPASSTTDPAISYRLQKLDRLESSLEKQLAAQSRQAEPDTGSPAVVYTRAPSPASAEDHDEDEAEHEDEHEAEHEDAHEDEQEDERDD